jgi:hypothetical protein
MEAMKIPKKGVFVVFCTISLFFFSFILARWSDFLDKGKALKGISGTVQMHKAA